MTDHPLNADERKKTLDKIPPEAHGTYAQTDFSEAAQKSRVHVEGDADGPHFSADVFVPPKP